MDNSLILDLHSFLTSIYGGLVAGFIYDLYRTFSYYSKPRKIISYISDLLFWTIMASLFFYILIETNWGELRGYIILGFLLGIYIYIKIFSKYIYPICVKIGLIAKKIVKGIVHILLWPLTQFKKKTSYTLKRWRNIPIVLIRELKRYKRIISTKK